MLTYNSIPNRAHFSIGESADYAAQVSGKTKRAEMTRIRRLIRSEQLPSIKALDETRIKRDDLLQYLGLSA